MITFRLSEEQEIVRDALHEFARDVMRPIARDCDEAAKLPVVSKDTQRRCDRADRLFDPQANGLLTKGQGMAYSFLSEADG